VEYSRNGGRIEYCFYVNGKKYYGHTGYGSSVREIKKLFIGKNFPVAYSYKNISNNMILIIRHDFSLIRLELPDSLLWAQKYF
jgi:hypothetical protein